MGIDPGRFLMRLGAFVFSLGLLIYAGRGIFRLGHLPGDILIKKDGFTFYFPLTSGLVVSGLLTLLGWLLRGGSR